MLSLVTLAETATVLHQVAAFRLLLHCILPRSFIYH